MLLAARDARGLALTAAEPGATTVLLGEAWLRRRRSVVLLEVIERRPQRPLRRRAYEGWRTLVVRPALLRALAGAQAMSASDERRLAARARRPQLRGAADRLGALHRCRGTARNRRAIGGALVRPGVVRLGDPVRGGGGSATGH